MEVSLGKARIEELFRALDEELRHADVVGELYVVGGAVMCLALNARPATRDVDAAFKPPKAVRDAARRVGAQLGVPESWLNDAAKGYLSSKGEYTPFMELPNLRVMAAQPEYLLAMKCLAFRLGAEFHDEADVRYAHRHAAPVRERAFSSALQPHWRRHPRLHVGASPFQQPKALHSVSGILGAVRLFF